MKIDVLGQKEIILNFVKRNPKTTYREIRLKTKLHPERIFKGGMKEIFQEAKVSSPRTLEFKSKEERKKILIDFVRNSPTVGLQIIRKETKINHLSVFKNVNDLYKAAKVPYPRNKRIKLAGRSVVRRKKRVIDTIKKNPLISVDELVRKTNVQVYHIFRNMEEIYKLAGLRFLTGNKKRNLKKRSSIVEFIRKNPLATQREINAGCKTHVQEVFEKGIFEAYNDAGIAFPFDRINLHGSALKDIKERARLFEEQIAVKLAGYGKVNRLIKTRRGVADILFERKENKVVIEIKDYFSHNISISQIKQLNRYLEDSNCCLGFIVCRRRPKKDSFLIGNNKIIVLEETELNKIPEIMDRGL